VTKFRHPQAGAASLFAHGAYPLARTLDYLGDPGLFGPGSMTWPVVGDTGVFVGGIRTLLVQAAHPEVAAGVAQHSRYREDPLGRLTRTAAYVTATSFGAMPEVERAVAMVRGRHRPVAGRSDRGPAYDASDPALSAWVHNSLTDSFLTAYWAYGARPCLPADADRYVREQVRVGELLGADPLPDTAAALSAWVTGHPDLAPSPAAAQAIRFLRRPRFRPLSGLPTGCCCGLLQPPCPAGSGRSSACRPAWRPWGRPGRGDRAAMVAGIVIGLAPGPSPHRLFAAAGGAVPPAAARLPRRRRRAGPALTPGSAGSRTAAPAGSARPPQGRPRRSAAVSGQLHPPCVMPDRAPTGRQRGLAGTGERTAAIHALDALGRPWAGYGQCPWRGAVNVRALFLRVWPSSAGQYGWAIPEGADAGADERTGGGQAG
jgi:uncharacterized protein (DUF2236 family)